MSKEKVYYIDNLRVLLIVLVVLHHSFITYGAPGGWYYKEATHHAGVLIPMTIFVSLNQSFFMGFFFFLSALFIESSIDKKGTRRFVTDRLKRLGIPLVFYSVVLSPFIIWLLHRFGNGENISFWQFLKDYNHWVNFGVLWFVAALLIFTFIYVLVRPLIKKNTDKLRSIPSNKTILLFSCSLAISSWLVRIAFPIGWELEPIGFQLAYFSQYIALFIVGIVAARNQWLVYFDIKKVRLFLRVIGMLMLIGLPLLLVVKLISGNSDESFSGGGTYQSLILATWEQVIGISIMAVLLGYGREKWNKQSALFKTMSRSAYAVYIFHPVVLVALAILFKGLEMEPSVKLLFVAPLAVVFSFLLGGLLVRIPGVRNII
jgi:peptidoglycan/LPS O-acetylase OafA/YrhL